MLREAFVTTSFLIYHLIKSFYSNKFAVSKIIKVSKKPGCTKEVIIMKTVVLLALMNKIIQIDNWKLKFIILMRTFFF